jgi:hypothetical protein
MSARFATKVGKGTNIGGVPVPAPRPVRARQREGALS